MKAFVIVQARMGSSRFPGKSMALLDGEPILSHLFRQLSFCRRVARAILATSDRPQDDVLAQYCESQGWDIFRGDEADVLSRYRGAAAAFGATAETPIVRCTGDDIWPDPGILDALVDIYEGTAGSIDCVCTDRGDRFPYGADLELWPFRVLERAHRDATEAHDREHVSPYILRNVDAFPRIELIPSTKLNGISLSIDRPEDLERNARLLANLKTFAEPPYRLRDIVAASQRISL